ncbi:hypothetical protein FA041_10500 [Escherichia coli]|nr:hypothetical protein [Escherichia coli]
MLPPDKEAVWAFALENKPVDQPRKADVIMLDGKHIIEAVVDLQNNKLLSRNPLKTPTEWCCWMISPVCRTLLTTVKNLPLP